MGIRFTWRCPACGYSAVVAGGRGSLMVGCTLTVSCPTCGTLQDVLSDDWLGGSGGLREAPRCASSRHHHVKPGRGGVDRCPRCGEAPMRHDGEGRIVD